MIDVATYRQSESLARQNLNSWRVLQAQHPHVFASSGFPVRIESFGELRMLLDTMQENRYGKYMVELGGLSDLELGAFVDALALYAHWYQGTFHGSRHMPIPLSTMLAHYALFRKITSVQSHGRILEIGPGCGYLSFFIFNDPSVDSYCQIEATESFYLLQNSVNSFLYRNTFTDHICEDERLLDESLLLPPVDVRYYDSEVVKTLPVSKVNRCEHLPWWRMERLSGRKFDVITSNANFNEMSEAAFRTYAALIGRSLADDGILFAQCLGGGPLSLSVIIRTLESHGLGVLALTDTMHGRPLPVPNLVMVRTSHPSYGAAAVPLQQQPFIAAGLPWLDAMYQPSPGAASVSEEVVITLLRDRLSSLNQGAFANSLNADWVRRIER